MPHHHLTATPFWKHLRAPKHWRSMLAIAMMILATMTGYYSILGLLFLWWILPAIHFGELHFVEVINIRRDPVMFWVMSTFWIVTSLAMILWDLYMFTLYIFH